MQPDANNLEWLQKEIDSAVPELETLRAIKYEQIYEEARAACAVDLDPQCGWRLRADWGLVKKLGDERAIHQHEMEGRDRIIARLECRYTWLCSVCLLELCLMLWALLVR